MTLVPALLAETPEELARQSERVAGMASLIHYDVADGTFVPLATPQPDRFPVPPLGTRVFWHLMAHRPAQYLELCVPSAAVVALHAEADDVVSALDWLESQAPAVRACLVLNPETAPAAVQSLMERVSLVQVMTVVPGAQGRGFLADQLAKIDEVRAMRPGIAIAIDGGINRGTIDAAAARNPEYVAIGSALLEADDPADEYEILKRLAAIPPAR